MEEEDVSVPLLLRRVFSCFFRASFSFWSSKIS